MSLTALLVIYLLGVLVLALFGIFVVYNFLRYRFNGDKTLPIIGVFVVMSLLAIVGTLLLLQPTSGTSTTPSTTTRF